VLLFDQPGFKFFHKVEINVLKMNRFSQVLLIILQDPQISLIVFQRVFRQPKPVSPLDLPGLGIVDDMKNMVGDQSCVRVFYLIVALVQLLLQKSHINGDAFSLCFVNLVQDKRFKRLQFLCESLIYFISGFWKTLHCSPGLWMDAESCPTAEKVASSHG